MQRDPGEQINILPAPSQEGRARPAGSLEGQIEEAFWDHLVVENLQRLTQMKLAEKYG